MHPFRTTARWLRVALAVLFAAVTVIQVPAMAVACATGSSQHRANSAPAATHHGDHHHAHAGHRHLSDPVTDATHDPPVCQAMSCCIALAPSAVRAPTASHILLGMLDLAPARQLLPASPEPADPPPRLRV